MHPTYLGVLERGHGNPTWDKLSDLAEALDIAVSTLAREAEDLRSARADHGTVHVFDSNV